MANDKTWTNFRPFFNPSSSFPSAHGVREHLGRLGDAGEVVVVVADLLAGGATLVRVVLQDLEAVRLLDLVVRRLQAQLADAEDLEKRAGGGAGRRHNIKQLILVV